MSLNIKYENMLDDFEPNDGYARIDYYDEETINKLAEHYYEILKLIGDNPDREGLEKTPIRVAKSMQFLMHGYYADPEQILRSAMFKEDYREMVIVKDIEVYSMCEHHMLPFIGKAHVAYIPNEKIVGISKLARLVDIYARRLQIQERIGQQVTDDLMRLLKPKGAACIIEAQHLCMLMRGVNKQNSVMVTSSLKGVFLQNNTSRQELMNLIHAK